MRKQAKKDPGTLIEEKLAETLKILASFPGIEDDKKTLIVMASNGQPKPSINSKNTTEKRLARALKRYTLRDGKYYDPDFWQIIFQLRIDWLPYQKLRAEPCKNYKPINARLVAAEKRIKKKKRTLIRMAAKGQSKPSSRSKRYHERILGRAFNKYVRDTEPNKKNYDPDFHKTILELSPDWLKSETELKSDRLQREINKILAKMGYIEQPLSAKKKKEILVQMAAKKLVKPTMTSNNPTEKKLALALRRYTYLTSICYDEKFRQTILELNPNWLSH